MKPQLIRLSISGVNEYSGGSQTHNLNIYSFLNSHGNYQIDHKAVQESIRNNRSFIPFNPTNTPIVFNRNFECISHQSSIKYRCHKHNFVAYLVS